MEQTQQIIAKLKKPYHTKNLKCPECGEIFYRKGDFYSHLKISHNKKREFPCMYPGCGKILFSNRNLKDHVLKMHTGKPTPMRGGFVARTCCVCWHSCFANELESKSPGS